MPPATITALAPMIPVVFFIFGCCVGSFLNVCVWRLPRGINISEPLRSFCPHCRASISWADNIPVLSFLLLRGKCRHCGAPISWRYPIIEALTGLLFAAVYFAHSTEAATGIGQVIVMTLTVALLIAASAIDMEFFIIPDEISIFGILGGLAAGLALPEIHVGTETYHTFASLTGQPNVDGLLASAIGAAVGGGLVLAFAAFGALIFRKEAMGLGDAKLMAMVGALLGWKVAVLAFFLSPFFGLLYGIPLLLISGEHVMPYGPFLSSASVLIIIFRTAAGGYMQRLIDSFLMLFRAIFGG